MVLNHHKKAYNRLKVQVEEKDVVTDSQRLFSELADEWFEQYKNTVRESTYVSQKSAYKKHIFPFFGNLKISKISIPYCQKQVNHWYSYYKKILKLDWFNIIRFQVCLEFTAHSK
ncbi:N-terminal phage integrase SAM-like domain-containing protein [Enterococcus durans]|uniref:N-terminal phage integrase SAM-like domain-containing protein n=1 Tax=Enterococcus durans TaxID=53345 RepID=UPI00223ACFF8|nr:N-terminal phage integrase SAM-like domain-containing protein [Enterococcus durans]